jgi:hypothetical protein
MKCANASKLHRKSGVRSGEPGAPVLFLLASAMTHTPGGTRSSTAARKGGTGFQSITYLQAEAQASLPGAFRSVMGLAG